MLRFFPGHSSRRGWTADRNLEVRTIGNCQAIFRPLGYHLSLRSGFTSPTFQISSLFVFRTILPFVQSALRKGNEVLLCIHSVPPKWLASERGQFSILFEFILFWFLRIQLSFLYAYISLYIYTNTRTYNTTQQHNRIYIHTHIYVFNATSATLLTFASLQRS